MFKRLFKKRATELVSFYTGTDGLKKHSEFIDSIDEKGIKIIHTYTLYHKYSSSHMPEYLNYVISYKD